VVHYGFRAASGLYRSQIKSMLHSIVYAMAHTLSRTVCFSALGPRRRFISDGSRTRIGVHMSDVNGADQNMRPTVSERFRIQLFVRVSRSVDCLESDVAEVDLITPRSVHRAQHVGTTEPADDETPLNECEQAALDEVDELQRPVRGPR
jgi:hypothetical protein